MSAIFGVYNRDSSPGLPSYLERMGQALAEHGPDGGGVRIDGPMGIGQRLMCFTPEDKLEQQPVVDGPMTLVSDARIDNRPELAQMFGLSGREAAALPDSAFILRAFEKWGQDCGLHLIGEYAFAIWDAKRQQLLAVRSPLGGRMLFYYDSGPNFAFATVPRGLLALPFVPRVLNESKVAGSLVGAHPRPEDTFFQGINRLLPGHALTVDANGVNIRRYWEPDLRREIRFKNDDDYIEAFLELYDRVTGDALRSLTPVGIFMSGGLDSASLAATAALLKKRSGESLSSFTEVPRSGFEGHMPRGLYADETPFVQAMAGMHSNLDAHFVSTAGQGLLDGVETLFDHSGMPFRNVSNRVWWEAILQRAKEQGTRVLLSGEQGNLTISWDGKGLIEELVRGGKWRQVLAEARATARHGQGQSVARVLIGQGLLPFFSPRLLHALAQKRRGQDSGEVDLSYSPIRPEFAQTHNVIDSIKALEVQQSYQDRTQMKLSRYQTLVAPDMAGSYNTGYRAIYGVETRLPLGDLRLVEFCLALPEAQQRRDGQTRSLIRRAMNDRLPPKLINNQMRGMQAADWLARWKDSRAVLLNDLALIQRSDLANKVLDLSRLSHLLEERSPDGHQVLLNLESYRLIESGLMMGRFLRWFEAGAND